MATALRELEPPMVLKSRSFTVSLAPLTVIEQIALECIAQVAREGRVLHTDELRAAIGNSNESGSTVTGVINRLVKEGYVERIGGHLQKALWLRILPTGAETAEPRNKTPHWRYRAERIPHPTIHRVSEYAKPLAMLIEAKARSIGKPLNDFLMDCVYVGFNEIVHEDGE